MLNRYFLKKLNIDIQHNESQNLYTERKKLDTLKSICGVIPFLSSPRKWKPNCYDKKQVSGGRGTGDKEGWLQGHRKTWGDSGNVCHLHVMALSYATVYVTHHPAHFNLVHLIVSIIIKLLKWYQFNRNNEEVNAIGSDLTNILYIKDIRGKILKKTLISGVC